MGILVKSALGVGNADRGQHVGCALTFLGLGGRLPVLNIDHLRADRQHRIVGLHRVLEDDGDVSTP